MGRAVSQGSCSAVRVLAAALCLMVLAECAIAATVSVGGNDGWSLGVDLSGWSRKNKVNASDKLLFKYDSKAHNVLMVSKSVYNSCNPSKVMATYSSGYDQIQLSKPGTYYFICGIGDHCSEGLKVAITVK